LSKSRSLTRQLPHCLSALRAPPVRVGLRRPAPDDAHRPAVSTRQLPPRRHPAVGRRSRESLGAHCAHLLSISVDLSSSSTSFFIRSMSDLICACSCSTIS